MSVKFKRIDVGGREGQQEISLFLEENNIKAEDVIDVSICPSAIVPGYSWWCITYNVEGALSDNQGLCEDCDVPTSTCRFVKDLKDTDLSCPHFVPPF